MSKCHIVGNLMHWLIFCFVAMIKQFVSDVVWKDMDYLVIDTPPGTSDEHITVVESLKRYNPDGAILVTTPQVMSSCLLQGFHRLEKYLNLEGFLEKSLKIKSALKSTGKTLKSLEKSLNFTIFCRN